MFPEPLAICVGTWVHGTLPPQVWGAVPRVLESPLVTTEARTAQKLSGRGQHYPCLMIDSVVMSKTTAPWYTVWAALTWLTSVQGDQGEVTLRGFHHSAWPFPCLLYFLQTFLNLASGSSSQNPSLRWSRCWTQPSLGAWDVFAITLTCSSLILQSFKNSSDGYHFRIP